MTFHPAGTTRRILAIALATLAGSACAQTPSAAERRAAELVSRMTLEEKAGQIQHRSAAIPRLGIPAYNRWNEGLHGVARTGEATVFPYNPGSPDFKDSTRFVDAKISYKWKPSVEFFVEGRNPGNATTSGSQGGFAGFAAGTPNLPDYSYAGRRIMVGVNFRTL
jgi:hypothetical protein